jgi:Zn2+/Cd2+-exporting ATPase
MRPQSETAGSRPPVTTWPPSTSASVDATPRRVFVVEGMDCAAEVRALEGELLPLLGGDRSRLVCDVLAARLTVTSSHSELSDSALLAAVSRAGLRAEPLDGSVAGSNRWSRSGRMVATTASGLAITVGITIHSVSAGSLLAPLGLPPATTPVPIAAVAAFLLATAAGLVYVAPRALAALRALRGDMHLLMTVAVVGALGLGEYLEAASVSFLFSLSLLLESWSVARARRAVQSLLELSPHLARRRDEGGIESLVPPHELRVGECAVIHAGERIPLDGLVKEGVAHVDSSPLTGESIPLEAEPGTELFAGSVCLDGTLVIRVLRPAGDTLLARVVRRVTEARRHRARAEQWVDRFARVYTPVVFALAGLTALLPPLFSAGPWQEWFYRGLVLLVIGCPCALVISTPVSVVAGLTSAARHGVLVKGGDILELPARIAAIAFDKTGTLTRGTLRVEKVLPPRCPHNATGSRPGRWAQRAEQSPGGAGPAGGNPGRRDRAQRGDRRSPASWSRGRGLARRGAGVGGFQPPAAGAGH